MGEVRAYNPTPPPTDSEIDVASYNFKVVQVTVDNRKVGWDRFQVKLPAEVRASYYRDIVYGAEWRALMKDFDQRFLTTNHEQFCHHALELRIPKLLRSSTN